MNNIPSDPVASCNVGLDVNNSCSQFKAPDIMCSFFAAFIFLSGYKNVSCSRLKRMVFVNPAELLCVPNCRSRQDLCCFGSKILETNYKASRTVSDRCWCVYKVEISIKDIKLRTKCRKEYNIQK